MPIIKAAKKSIRQDKKKKQRNIHRKKTLKLLLREAMDLVEQNKKEEAKKLLPQIYKALDKNAKNNVIKKNTSARKKSRITKLLNKSDKTA